MGLTKDMDERIAEIFLAPSKHARDVYNLIWTEGLGSSYDEGQKVDLGAANQLHHNNSLVADDLMDGDDKRRGVPTFHNSGFLNEKFSSDTVDSLTISQVIKYTTLPYAMITESRIPERDQPEIINAFAGNVMELVEGQNEDLTGGDRLVIEDDEAYIDQGDGKASITDYYYNMVDGKTGALFEAAAGTAAIAAEYDGSKPAQHGRELGRLLQITDDILDYDKDADKDHLSDLVESKPTLLVGYGLDVLEGDRRRKLREVLESDDPDEEDLYEVEDIFRENGIIQKGYETARDHVEEAKEIVDELEFEDPEAARDLKNLTDVIYARSE